MSLREGIFWNAQWKNNFVNLAHDDSDAVAFARYNNGFVRANEKALMTEHNREHLLGGKLGVERVQHMLVSQFPAVTDNPRIFAFSHIAEFAMRADIGLTASECLSPHA